MICNFTFHLIYIYINIFFFLWISGYSLLRDPHHNKGLAFSEKERDSHYLRGLLPPTVISQELQVIYPAFTYFSFSMFNLYSRLLFCWICVIFDYPWYFPRQVKKMLHNIRQYQVPLQKYMAMMDLQVPFWQFFLMLISSSQNLRNFLI